MRVSLIAPVDPFVERPGGTRTYVMSLITFLQESRIDFSLAGVDFDPSDGSPSWEFIPVVKARKVSSVRFLRGLMKATKDIASSDDIILHAQRPDYLFPFVFRKYPNKKVCTLHGQIFRSVDERKGGFYGRAYRLLESYALKRIDHVIAVDKSTLNIFVNNYPFLANRSSLIPIGLHMPEWGERDFEELRKKLGYSPRQKIGLYVGRLEKEKNVDLIIQSVALVRKTEEDFILIIIGDGTQRGRLEKLARKMVPQGVSFMGPQPSSVVHDMLAIANVFCLASSYESGPLVILESLASGTPVVAPDVGRVREFISDPMIGRVVSRNPEAIADAILDILRMSKSVVRSSCRKRAREFSFEKTFQETLKVYENLSEGRN